jgi:hypothetical protein
MAKYIVKCSALDNQHKSKRVNSPEFDAKNDADAIKLAGGHVDALISAHSLTDGQYKVYRCKRLFSSEKCIAEGPITPQRY